MRATSKTLNPFFWLLPLLLAWALLAGQPVSLKTASGQNSGPDTASTGFAFWQALPRLGFGGLAEKEAAVPLVGAKGVTGTSTALEELSTLPNLAGKTPAEIESMLRAQGFSSVTANNGGTVWTKALPDGNTAAVRLDPATIRTVPKSFADEVPHVHKEIVPTTEVKNGNYKPGKAVTTLDDSCCATKNPADTHIPTK